MQFPCTCVRMCAQEVDVKLLLCAQQGGSAGAEDESQARAACDAPMPDLRCCGGVSS